MKINEQIYIFLLLLLTYYLTVGIFVQIGIIFLSIYYLNKNDELNLFLFYFTIFFLIPYDYNNLTISKNVGNLLNSSFLASLPLYIGFSTILNSRNKLNKNLKILLVFFFIIFFASTLLKGLFALVTIGSERVRIALVINYFNIFVIVFWASRVLISSVRLKIFAQHLIVLGGLISIFGLIQYSLKFYFFENTYSYANVERLSIIANIEPVDMFPYIIVPFSFALNYLFSKFEDKKTAYIVTILLLLTTVFSWSRWSMFCLVITTLISLLLNRKIKYVIIISIISVIIYIFTIFDILNIVPQDQAGRLSSEGNLITRVMLWYAAVYAIKENLWIGVGIGNSVTAYNNVGVSLSDFSQTVVTNIKDFYSGQSIHHFYLDWILQQGIFVVPAIMMLYSRFIRNSKSILSSTINPINQYVSKALICSVIGVSLFWMQNSGTDYFFLFLFLAISYSILNIQRNEDYLNYKK